MAAFWQLTDSVTSQWGHEGRANMLVEMRKVALLILVNTLFGADFQPDMPRLWLHVYSAGYCFYWAGGLDCVAADAAPGLRAGRDLALLGRHDLIARRRQQPGVGIICQPGSRPRPDLTITLFAINC